MTDDRRQAHQADGDTSIKQVIDALDELRDLFRRRLLDDRDKRRMLQRLFDELDDAKRSRVIDEMMPLLRSVFLVIDRIDRSGGDNALAASVRDELIEALLRQGIEEVDVAGPIDPALHEVRSVVGDGDGDLVVNQVERRGFLYGERLLRPAVVIAKRVGRASAGDPEGPAFVGDEGEPPPRATDATPAGDD